MESSWERTRVLDTIVKLQLFTNQKLYDSRIKVQSIKA